MTTEVDSVNTETVTVDLQKYEWLTVRQAMIRENISEKQVYNRIDSGYYRSTVIKGKKHVLLQKLQEGTEVNSEVHVETSETSTGLVQKSTEMLTEYVLKSTEKLTEEISDLKAKLETAELRAISAEKRVARLEGEISSIDSILASKDEVIKAKDQAINAANAAVMLMEQQKQTLDAKVPKQIETTLKKPWWRLGF
jgi:hypothetical protein